MGSTFRKGSSQSGQSQGVSQEMVDMSRQLFDQTKPLRTSGIAGLQGFADTGALPAGLRFDQTYNPVSRPTVPYSTVPFQSVPFQKVGPEALTGTIQDAASEESMMRQGALDSGVRGGALGNTLFQANLRRRMMVDAFRAQEAQKEQAFNLGEATRGRDFNLGEATGARNFNVGEAGASRDFAVGEAGAARDFGLSQKLAEQAKRSELFNAIIGTGFGEAPTALQGMGAAAGNLNTLGAQRIQQNQAFQGGAGQLTGAALGAMKAMCWVALRFYGDTFRTALLRHWFQRQAPRWMASLYAQHGEWVSRQWWCPVLRPVFALCVQRAMRWTYGTV